LQRLALLLAFGESNLIEGRAGDLEYDQQQPQQSCEPLDAPPKSHQLLSTLGRVSGEDVDADDRSTWARQPSARCRTRDALLEGASDIVSRPDEIPETMVITAKRASGRHGDLIVPAACRTIETKRDFPESIRLRWRELAHKSAECRGGQHCCGPETGITGFTVAGGGAFQGAAKSRV
jgi:hypothetical protein